MTRSAYHILEALGEVGDTNLKFQSPAVIAYNLDYSQTNVIQKLGDLAEAGMVEKAEEGRYRITDEGQAYLDGELDPERFELD